MKVMIIGGGKIGTFLARFLLDEQHDVLVVENSTQEIERLNNELGSQYIILGSGTDPGVLEAAGIRNMDVVAAVTGKDEVNLVTTNISRFEFNVPRIIARVNNPKNSWLFTADMGVDVALNQAELIGKLILEEMSLGDMVTLIKLRKGQYSIVVEKVDPKSILIGMKFEVVQLPDKCILIAILRREGMIIPNGDFIFREADEVIALIHSSQKTNLAKLLGARDK